MSELFAAVLSVATICAAALLHLQALRSLTAVQSRVGGTREIKVLIIILGLIAAHVLEATLFALGYGLGTDLLHIGRFVSRSPVDASMMFYFALEAFTTQGLGDIYPVGPLRLLASLEPFAGLILIGWSTSFTFIIMRLDWQLQDQADMPAERVVPAADGAAV